MMSGPGQPCQCLLDRIAKALDNVLALLNASLVLVPCCQKALWGYETERIWGHPWGYHTGDKYTEEVVPKLLQGK